MNNEIAIIVMSCDSYKDLWPDFFALKRLNWPNCSYDTYLVTNNEVCEEENVKTIVCGDELNWTGRLQKCLNEIHADYVILMLEDYYISSKVDNFEVQKIVSFIKLNNVSYYKLETRGTRFPTIFGEESYIKSITPDIRYGISLITSIWKIDFLLEVLNGEDYTAWEFELLRNRPDDITKTTDKLCLCDERNILNIVHTVQRGRYIRSALKKLKKLGYRIDSKERKKLSYFFDFYIKITGSIKNHRKLHAFLTKFLGIFGIKSISKKYENEIEQKKYK